MAKIIGVVKVFILAAVLHGSLLAEVTPKQCMKQGNAYYAQGKFKAALQMYSQAVKQDPGLISGWENLGRTYFQLGSFDDSIRTWETLRSIFPSNKKYFNLLGKSYSAKKDYVSACYYYERSLEIDNKQKDVKMCLAGLKTQLHEYDESVSDHVSPVKQYPDDSKIRWKLAKLLIDLKRDAESIALKNSGKSKSIGAGV